MQTIPLKELKRIAGYYHEGNIIFTEEAKIKNAKFIGSPKDQFIGVDFDAVNERTGHEDAMNLGFKVIAALQFNEESEFDSTSDGELSKLFKTYSVNKNNEPIKTQLNYIVDVEINLNYTSNIEIDTSALEEEGYYFAHGSLDYSELTNLIIQKIELNDHVKSLFNDEVSETEIINAIVKDYDLYKEFEKRINYALQGQGDPIVTYGDHEQRIPADV